MWTPKDVELAMSHLSKHVRAKTERSRVNIETELTQNCLDSGWRLRLGTPDIWVTSFFGLWPRLRVEVVAGLSKAGVV